MGVRPPVAVIPSFIRFVPQGTPLNIYMIKQTNKKSMKNMKRKQQENLVDEMVAPRKEKTKHLFGSVKVGERGQVVIPKEAREIFGIKPGYPSRAGRCGAGYCPCEGRYPAGVCTGDPGDIQPSF